MATIPLSDAKIRASRPAEGARLVLFDTVTKDDLRNEGLSGALCLRIGEKTKSFYAVYYEAAKPKYHRLGRYPTLTLAKAREAAKAFLRNPQTALAERAVGTVAEIGNDFLQKHVKKKKLRSEGEITRILKTRIYPRVGDRKFFDLKRSEIVKLLDEVEEKHGVRQAEYCLSILRQVANWMESRHDNYRSPIVRSMSRRSIAAHARSRILDDDELKAVWKAAGDAGTYGGIVKLCLLTAQRRSKIRDMKRADIDDAGVWAIATEAREKGNAGQLQLPPIALEIINEQPRLADNPFVFAVPGGVAFNSFSQGARRLNKMLPDDMPGFVLHDLRRTARSLMARAGVLPHIAERVLGHAIGGVEGVYDRHQYKDEKAEALSKLAALIDAIVNPKENVIPIRS